MPQKLAYTTTHYKENRKPSEDASSVGRWIIGTSILYAFFGFGMFGGTAWASGFPFWQGFSWGLVGAGFFGFLMGALRIATYDKKPYIDIREDTTEPFVYDDEEAEVQQPIGGNTPVNTALKDSHIVSYKNDDYEFTDSQINGMYTRVENGVNRLSRDAFGFGADYDRIMKIMGGLGYWIIKRKAQKDGIKRSAEWSESGKEWLESRMRGIK